MARHRGGRGGREPGYGERAQDEDHRLAHEQSEGADAPGKAGHGDADELADELRSRRDGDGALPLVPHHAREQGIARRHHEGGHGTHGESVDEEGTIAERARGHDGHEGEGGTAART